MLLTHGAIELLSPLAVKFAELAVLVARGFALLVLLPQQHERELLVLYKLIVKSLPVGLGQLAGSRINNGGIEAQLKGFIIEIRRQRPDKTGSDRPVDGVVYGGLADTTGSGCITSALVTRPDKAEYLSYLSHGNSFSRHHALLVIQSRKAGYLLELPRDYTLILHWPDCSGMVAAIKSECRPDSRRNGGRFPAGMVAGFVRNTHISELVDAPYVEEAPLVVECRLLHTFELGLHTQFIGEIVDVKADPAFIGEKGYPDITKVRPMIWDTAHRGYYGIGAFQGKAWEIGKSIG